MKKLTKIVGTISNKKCEADFIKKLVEAGLNGVRINTAHMTPAEALTIIENTRMISDKIPIMIDTKGPEMRSTFTEKDIEVKQGEEIYFKGAPDENSSNDCICVNYKGFVDDVPVGSRILIDDGDVEFLVKRKDSGCLLCEVLNSGTIGSKKSVNVPNVVINLPALKPADIEYINFAVDNDVTFIAHSFVRDKYDLLAIQEILNAKSSKIKLIAKIENQQGVDNIDEILDYAYGIIIARGDLGVEIPAERIPGIQKMLEKKCIERRRLVITATQMLHSMIKNPRPTRAEVNDVANAVYDRVDTLLLSGETAYGAYPVEAVKTLSKIAREVESSREWNPNIDYEQTQNHSAAYLARSAVHATQLLDIKAVIADSVSGRTIRELAAYRSCKPVFAMCYSRETMKELALSYGVVPEFMAPRENTHEFIIEALHTFGNVGGLSHSDQIVVLAGNFGTGDGATYIEICETGKLLERQQGFEKERREVAKMNKQKKKQQ